MNCFCLMELHPEFGLDHPSAVSSTLELMEFSVMSWLSCHCPSPAPKILPNLPLATTTSCGHEGLSSVAHIWGPQALEMLWDTQHMQLDNMIQDFWESQANDGRPGAVLVSQVPHVQSPVMLQAHPHSKERTLISSSGFHP